MASISIIGRGSPLYGCLEASRGPKKQDSRFVIRAVYYRCRTVVEPLTPLAPLSQPSSRPPGREGDYGLVILSAAKDLGGWSVAPTQILRCAQDDKGGSLLAFLPPLPGRWEEGRGGEGLPQEIPVPVVSGPEWSDLETRHESSYLSRPHRRPRIRPRRRLGRHRQAAVDPHALEGSGAHRKAGRRPPAEPLRLRSPSGRGGRRR